ncbi:MAG: DUF4401 domain-containing protein [Chitinophagaceae bacterium]
MNHKEHIQNVIGYFNSINASPIEVDEERIEQQLENAYQSQSLLIKIMSVLGGFLASLAFVGFLFMIGIYRSEFSLLFFGFLFIVAAIWMIKTYKTILFETMSVSFYMIGFLMVGFGLGEMKLAEVYIPNTYILLSLITFCLVQNYLLNFVALQIINGSILFLIFNYHAVLLLNVYVGFLAILLTAVCIKESFLLTYHSISKNLFKPIVSGLFIAFIISLSYLAKEIAVFKVTIIHYHAISLAFILFPLIYLLLDVFKKMEINKQVVKVSICVATVLLLIPTVIFPAIAGALLIILLGFWSSHNAAFVLGVLSCMYFVAQCYYDLEYTLLTKSIMLFITGILFCSIYFLTVKKLSSNEAV